MTMYVSGTAPVGLCGVPAPNVTTVCAITAASGTTYDQSAVVAFPGTAGQAISYYTTTFGGVTLAGNYEVIIVLEQLF